MANYYKGYKAIPEIYPKTTEVDGKSGYCITAIIYSYPVCKELEKFYKEGEDLAELKKAAAAWVGKEMNKYQSK